MNFFEQQDLARRNTRRLVFLLAAAVLSLIFITTLLFAGIIAFLQKNQPLQYEGQSNELILGMMAAFNWELLGWISLIVGGVILTGSFYKIIQLRSGGSAVAQAMGGRLINLNASDNDEKKILNVVEEMAIASGTPVPPVYLIEDDAINAFAAGHSPQDAVIGITRGCIRLLKRDELQGVVAHEFSHIFHGDMRLNIRLVALLNGILLLGLIGQYMVRASTRRGLFRSSRDKSPVAILSIGVALVVIGYSGTFFGNLIKAAVSRQREFLADASAVQFTRNPEGISGALKKIGGYVTGSRLESVHAAEFSHMYFSQGVSTAFNAMMATHPPLPERIKRIEPRWDGKYPQVEITLKSAQSVEGVASQFAPPTEVFDASTQSADINATIENIGQPTPDHLAYAQTTLTNISNELRDAAHDPFYARALIFGLLLDRKTESQAQQWLVLRSILGEKQCEALEKIVLHSSMINERARLPLLELSLPALKQLSPEQYGIFKRCLIGLIQADKKVSLMEWALHRIVIHHIEGHAVSTRQQDLHQLRDECQQLLSVLAYAGAKTETEAQTAFQRATESLRFESLSLLPKNAVKIAKVDEALNKLNLVKALQKPQLLKAMSQCILSDGEVTLVEIELFRAIADGLDCPVPPLLLTR